MKKLMFTVGINSDKMRVWNILWNDESFRDWASIIDKGTYMKGTLIGGNKVEFISSVNCWDVLAKMPL